MLFPTHRRPCAGRARFSDDDEEDVPAAALHASVEAGLAPASSSRRLLPLPLVEPRPTTALRRPVCSSSRRILLCLWCGARVFDTVESDTGPDSMIGLGWNARPSEGLASVQNRRDSFLCTGLDTS